MSLRMRADGNLGATILNIASKAAEHVSYRWVTDTEYECLMLFNRET